MAEETNKLMSVTSNPHIRDSWTTQKIMMHVIIALMPATLFGVWHFGAYTIAVILVTVISSMFFEYLYEKLMKLPITVSDCSAALTGLLLALNMPPRIPLWICVIGSLVAIVLVKQLFGGLGQNFMNPALGARCFLVISFASYMTNFAYDTYSGATCLMRLKSGELVTTAIFSMTLSVCSLIFFSRRNPALSESSFMEGTAIPREIYCGGSNGISATSPCQRFEFSFWSKLIPSPAATML